MNKKPKNPDLIKVPVGYRLPRFIIDAIKDSNYPAPNILEPLLINFLRIKPPEGYKPYSMPESSKQSDK